MPNGRRFRFQLCRVANSGKIDFCRSQKKCVQRRRRILRLNHKLSLVKGKICRKLNLKNNLAISLFLLPSQTIIEAHSRKSRVLTPSNCNYNSFFFIKSLHIESAVSFERKNRLTFGNKITADVSSLIRPRYRFDVKKCFKKFKSDFKIYIILLAKKNSYLFDSRIRTFHKTGVATYLPLRDVKSDFIFKNKSIFTFTDTGLDTQRFDKKN